MKTEFEALRAEMLAWQNRRFLILALSISLVTGILGLDGVSDLTSRLEWTLVVSLLFYLLGTAEALTWYAGLANAKAAAYLIVFHEANPAGWESRLKELTDSGLNRISLNVMVALIYAGLGVLSLVIPIGLREVEVADGLYIWALAFSGAWFLFGLYLLLRPLPKDYYEKLWGNIKAQEEKVPGKSSDSNNQFMTTDDQYK